MAVRMCRWCDSVVPEDATACPACGGLDLQPLGVRPTTGETNGLAIAALALAVLWFGGIGSVIAIVLGSTAKAQLAERNERGEGLAVAAVVLGIIGLLLGAVLGIAAFLVSI